MHRFESAAHTVTKAKVDPSAQSAVPKKILVIGGTQFIGKRLVGELVRAGHDVSILHRKPEHGFGKRVHNLMADRNDAESLKQAIGTLRFDAVFDNAYDWEHGTTG